MSPVKIQGRKNKIVPWLSSMVDWFGGGRRIESFMGSCGVGLAMFPPDGAISGPAFHERRVRRA